MRVAVLVVVLAVVAVTVVRVVWVRKGGETRWKDHDEALVLFQAGRHAEAAGAYRRILEDHPGDRIARFNLGLALVRSGDDGGWAEIEALAASDPTFDDAQLALADHAVAGGDLRGAVARLSVAIEHPPEPPGARARLAELLLSLGRRPEAMHHLREVMSRTLDGPAVRASAAIRLAREHGRQADVHRSPAEERRKEQAAYRVAIQVAEQAGVLDGAPEDWDETKAALGALRPFALAATGREEEALGAVELALRAPIGSSERAGLRVLRAQIYWIEGEPERAAADLEAVLAEPAGVTPATFLAAADLYESRGLRPRAEAVLRAGLDAHPADEQLRLSLARVLFLTGRADEAEEALRADREVPSSDAALMFLGDLRRFRGDRSGARAAYALLSDRRPGSADIALRLASLDAQVAYESGASSPNAVDELERRASDVLARRPEDAEGRLAMARVRLLRLAEDGAEGERRLRDVRGLLKQAIDADPLLFEAHIVLAHVQARLGAFDEAAVGLERVISSLPAERPYLRILLSQAYVGLGVPRRALEEARRALDGLGDDPRALRAVFDAAGLAGDRAAALDAMRRLVAVQPDVLGHRLSLALLLADDGDIAAADACFADADRLASAIADEEERAAALRDVTRTRAEAFLRRGDESGARGAFEALLERYPDRVEARVAYGRFLRAIGSETEAEQAFQLALASAPDALAPRRALADLWADRGVLTPELTDLVRRMREIGGDDPLVLYAEGRLAALQGDFQLARERLEACAGALRQDADAQFALGVVLSQAGRLDDAVAALERAVGLAPRSMRARDALARARFALARELARLGRLRAARELLAGSVREDPDAVEPRRAFLGLLGMTEGVEASEEQIREMLAREPGDLVLRQMLAAALVQQEDYAGATRELVRVAEADPGDWAVWSSLTIVRLRAQDVESAERFAARARATAPDDPRSLAPVLQVLSAQGRAAEARAQLDEAVAGSPDEPFYRLLRAVQRARDQRFDEVVEDASAALELAPAMTQAAHLGIYALRYGLGSPQRAEEFARACAARAPEVAEYAFLVGWLASDRGDGSAALDSLRPLAERDPPHQPALESVAMLLMRQGRTSEARELLDHGLDVNPENANFHYLRAQSLVQDAVASGDPDVRGPSRGVVLAALERTLELAPSHHTARNNLAYLLSFDEDRLTDALEHARRAAAEAPKSASYLDTLGVIELRMERVEDAITSFRRGLDVARESLLFLDREDAAVRVSEPGRAERLRRRLERQEAEIRSHLDEALARSRGE